MSYADHHDVTRTEYKTTDDRTAYRVQGPHGKALVVPGRFKAAPEWRVFTVNSRGLMVNEATHWNPAAPETNLPNALKDASRRVSA